jgi:hypothetical protein
MRLEAPAAKRRAPVSETCQIDSGSPCNLLKAFAFRRAAQARASVALSSGFTFSDWKTTQ